MPENTVPENYDYDVLINYGSDKPFYVLPGDSLTFTMEVHPSGKDKPPIQINLQIDFREPFTSDAVVVISMRADVTYPPGQDEPVCGQEKTVRHYYSGRLLRWNGVDDWKEQAPIENGQQYIRLLSDGRILMSGSFSPIDVSDKYEWTVENV